MTLILCIHGRAQHGKDPLQLSASWAAGLNFGLTVAGRPAVDPGSFLFPYFGDLLETRKVQATRAGIDLDLEGPMRLDPTMPEELAEVESDLLRSLAEQVDADAIDREGFEERILRIPGARRLLQIVAERTHVDQELIEGWLTDVAVYFKVARNEVLGLVEQAVPDGTEPLVILAHSLGSVVARDLLERPAIRDRTTLLVTLGSPLGLQACYRNLLAKKAAHPGVPDWLTVYDTDDFVALGHPLRGLYGTPLQDLRVDNPSGKAHSITHYLGHKEVALRVSETLDKN
jgi:hypothetical protein